MKEITTKCLNGDLRIGDLVLSTPDDDYACLIGRVLEINLLGTPEHDAETDNDTDDVHVNFMECGYTYERMKEIEAAFSALYGKKKRFYHLPLDDVIMAPGSLIRITESCDDRMCDFKESGYNVACYCYRVLREMTALSQSDGVPVTEASPDVTLDLMDTIENSVVLAGYEVLDGNRDSFIVRHGESDTDFEIKLSVMPG